MKLKALLTGLALAGGLAMAGTAANAATYLFTAAGTDYDGSFELSTPAYLVIPSPPLIGSYYFITDGSGAYASDVIVNLQPADIYTSSGQVLDVDFSLDGSGQVALSPGVYAAGSDYAGTLSISAVPEPATWAMMIMGAGLAGAGVRASRKRQSVVAA